MKGFGFSDVHHRNLCSLDMSGSIQLLLDSSDGTLGNLSSAKDGETNSGEISLPVTAVLHPATGLRDKEM